MQQISGSMSRGKRFALHVATILSACRLWLKSGDHGKGYGSAWPQQKASRRIRGNNKSVNACEMLSEPASPCPEFEPPKLVYSFSETWRRPQYEQTT